MEATNDSVVVTVEPGGSSTRQGQPAAKVSSEDIQLISRLVLGLVLFGGEELLFRLRAAQQRIQARGELATVDAIPDDETMTEVLERRIWGLVMEGQGAIQDGWREVVASRTLADRTMEELIKEAIHTLAENPELTTASQEVVTGQGASLTGTAMGSARQLSTSADDLTEGVVRRLLGRKPRRELPPSPLAGLPLTMYERGKPAQGGQDVRS